MIFNQPIELVNNLSATTKSWLHITDNEHFIEKLDDITCPHTNLDPLGIVTLAELLNLNSFYLKEYSNANYDKPTTPPDSLEIFDDIKTYERKPSGQAVEIEGDQNNEIVQEGEQSEEQKEELNTEESKALRGFVRQILNSVLKLSNAVVTIWDGASARENMAKLGITINKRLLVKVESNGIGKYCSKLSRFINNDVRAINPNLICWQDGDLIEENPKLPDRPIIETTDTPEPMYINSTEVKFHKSKTIIPHWLDLLLFNNLSAIYSPEHKKFEYNLDNDSEDIKVYLGTYFPRSYAESFCIFDDLFKSRSYVDILNNDSEINILDYGCGTGGELIGLIVSLSKHISSRKDIKIIAVDGNNYSLDTLKNVVEVLASNVRHNLSLTCINKTINGKDDLYIKDKSNFHFILNSKMGCELISRNIADGNCYYKIAEALAPLLSETGILYLLDVTIKDENSNLFYPQLMNQGLNLYISTHTDFSTLLPLACDNWGECQNACFMQQTFTISHSRKSNDESRVCYRLVCRKSFRDKCFPDIIDSKDCTHIIHSQKYVQNEQASLCPRSLNGKKIIDSFNIIT